jgi:hypothetical protein
MYRNIPKLEHPLSLGITFLEDFKKLLLGCKASPDMFL